MGHFFKKELLKLVQTHFPIFRKNQSLIETDEGKKFVRKFFSIFPISEDTREKSRFTNKGTVFVERFKRSKHDLIKELAFIM